MVRLLPLLLVALMLPATSSAQVASTTPTASSTPLEISGWIPYWRVSEGTRDAQKHLADIDVLHPFAYSVQPDGKLKDLAGLSKSAWLRLFKEARSKGVELLPTVMWSDTTAIHDILSSPTKRATHVRRILSMIKSGKFDGVDIDYEGKRAETKEFYSAFLAELKAGLGDKILSCTIEARTPPESLYKVVPTTLEYANDYAKLNEYCDRVNVMAYDQQRADLLLNAARTGAPYYPVADLEWVRKVMQLALKDIAKEKLILSVPTYGREVEVTVAPNWFQGYRQLWSVSEEYALDTAETYGITPSRNGAGELSFSYIPKESLVVLPQTAQAPVGTPSGNVASARALAYASATQKSVAVNLVWWSDAEAIRQKIELAKELGLRGVALFKIDGAEDEKIWDVID